MDWIAGLAFVATAVFGGIGLWFWLGRGLLRDIFLRFRRAEDRWKPPH